MKGKAWKRMVMLPLAAVLATSAPFTAFSQETSSASSFVEQFQNPEDEYKPWIRWWFSPGEMTEEETRRQVRGVYEDGFGGLEMVALRNSAEFGGEEWNETMRWILEEAEDCGLKLAYTIGVGWPIKTPAISDADDIRAQQGVFAKAVEFTADASTMEYSSEEIPFPDEQFESERPYELVAVTAAKKNEDGIYDAASAVDITESVNGIVEDGDFNDVSAASVNWTAPSEGEWTVFYIYRQGLESTEDATPVVDHFNADSTEAVAGYWDEYVLADDYIRSLYEANNSEIFCDSLELGNREKSKAALWTNALIEEFKERRGYDITPYLPVIFIENIYHNLPRAMAHQGAGMSEDWVSDYNFGEEGYRVRDDFFQTLTELFTENHVKKIADWAHTHNMELRYQVYGSVLDVTQSGLEVDLHETESLSAADILDFYRTQTGTVHMTGSGVYSTETAAVGALGWALSWTGSHQTDGAWDEENYYRTDGGNWTQGKLYKGFAGGVEDAGILYHMNREMAVGVNRIVMHGMSYDGAGMGTGYSNPWGDVSPLWENVNDMTDYLARSQFVLRQGEADIDLAVYHLRNYEWCYTEKSPTEDWTMTAVEKAGYSYDFVSPALLNLENAVISEENGTIVLAEDGPSYQAMVLDQRVEIVPDETGEAPVIGTVQNDMPVETAEKILSYAQAGLPIVVVGEAPSRVNSFNGSVENMAEEDSKLAAVMEELLSLDNVILIEEQDQVPGALEQLSVQPDTVKNEESSVLSYHRTTENAEYYYLYNSDLNNSVEQTIALKGEGTPYLLDPWSGTVTPLAEYQVQDGRIAIQVELEANENMFVAIAKEGWTDVQPNVFVTETTADQVLYDEDQNLAARVVSDGEYEFTFSNGESTTLTLKGAAEAFELSQWTMTVEDWQPSEDENPREFNKVVMGPYELDALVPWNAIEELETAGGVATYVTSFDLEEAWEDGVGAVIDFGYVADTMKLKVNGTSVSGINQFANKIDIGKYLVQGTNTIEVEVATSLANSKGMERRQEQGMVGPVIMNTYRQTVISAE